ncbi:poly(A) RNA polymerase gld-2 homolog A-like [Fopius arisanus]|uniref:Poly(A) RNA polymerase gld-2 homolog A-like n=1 Tax=Fopius arisanus TaxID=64838 RepID=A0A9R1U722_9HYME|nr:PREDICTED: poly(A) RNA polymerase gld-2 homolog A-like [Fopius arisanus]XP_011309657.1 PREDICTED: poly(A) RNA polymerase gld-2 homolog A-like [Fopius arisanus]
MYHTMLPPPMMVQIVGGQQTNGQCPNIPPPSIPTTSAATTPTEVPSPYVFDGSTQSHRLIHTSPQYPLEVYQMMGVEIPQFRRPNYGTPTSNITPWQRRVTTSSSTTLPTTNYRQGGFNSLKKSTWATKAKRQPSKELPPEPCNSDSGFSSRSPTPNKHTDSSQTESSDDRESTSSADLEIKRMQELPTIAIHNITLTPQGLISNLAPQYYQQQRPLNYYHSTIPAARTTQIQQNYQSKKRYHSGRSSSSPPAQKTQNRRKFTDIMVPTFNFYPRPYIAPDRFLARSHLMQVHKTPEDLVQRCRWDELSRDMWNKFLGNQQSEATFRNKMMLWKYLYIYIKSTYPRYGLFLVGSTMNGFGADSSDVDMCLLVRNTEMIQRNEAICHLDQIKACLKNCDFIDQLTLIQAKVPILKFHDGMQNLDIDLNCNNAVGIRNTHMLYCYSRIDWRVRPLVLVVKLWAQSQDINDAKNMTISSYSLVLMVIHFLQCGVHPAVLPCLHSMYGYKFNSYSDIHTIDIHEDLDFPAKTFAQTNRQPLGELLFEFFKYYSNFDFNQYAISVRLARKVPIDDCRRARSWKNDPHQWKLLCIEEPFDLTNTARSVYDYAVFSRIKTVFRRTYQRLKESMNLASIFVKQAPHVGLHYPHP